jgi:protein-disulfide isomerase
LLLNIAPLAACNEHPVEHCVAGQGLALPDQGAARSGVTHAPVELVLFGDFQCPFTEVIALELFAYAAQLEERGRGEQLQIVFRHFPLHEIHDRARPAAIAAAAAHRQGDEAFWEMFWQLFAPGVALTDEYLVYYADNAGLDLEQFESDLADPEVAAVVDRDRALALELGLPGTPSIILCGVPVAPDPDQLIENLEFLISK